MISSNFFNTIQKKIDKLSKDTLKNFLFQVIEENTNLKTVFNSMKEAVIVLDNDLNVSFYNKIAVTIFEIRTKNIIGVHIKDVIDLRYLIDIINNAILKDETLYDFELLLDTTNPKYIELSLRPLAHNGKIIGSMILANDITLQKENKNKLRQAESLAALTTISAGIAHEIKNPLGAMDIHMQLIEDEIKRSGLQLSSDFIFSINAIREEIKRLNSIVVDYLFTVRPLKANLLLVKIDVFLDKFCNFIKPELEASNIELIKHYDNLPEVWMDEKYFQQALLNLIKNSISVLDKNGIIKIEAFQEHNYIIINISDNGPGIPDEIKHKIFDPYFTTRKTGTGLGLTIVYKIIREHRGEISFSSEKGKTMFTIKLPLSYIQKGQIEYL